MAEVVVIGSSNTDMVIKTSRFPTPGETVLGGDFFMFHGGKGANQAVAAARLGAKVAFICCVGDDLFGRNAIEHYQSEGIDIRGVKKLKSQASGIALITIDGQGENEIVVAPGANNLLAESDIKAQKNLIQDASILLTQLETPLDVLSSLVNYSKQLYKRLILNPAPAVKLKAELFKDLFLITPNQTEAAFLTGITVNNRATAEKASQVFMDFGLQNVLITLGTQGAFFMNANEQFTCEAPKVKVQDTTAAGDVFNGALAVALSEQMRWPQAVKFAINAASFSVTRMGAQQSAPFRGEIS